MICKYFLSFWVALLFWECVLMYKNLKFSLSSSCLFFFCYLCLWCNIQEIINQIQCYEAFFCFLLSVLLVEVFDPFWVNVYTWHQVRVQIHSFAWEYLVFPVSFVEKLVLAPLSKTILTIYVRVYFRALCSIPLAYVSLYANTTLFWLL